MLSKFVCGSVVQWYFCHLLCHTGFHRWCWKFSSWELSLFKSRINCAVHFPQNGFFSKYPTADQESENEFFNRMRYGNQFPIVLKTKPPFEYPVCEFSSPNAALRSFDTGIERRDSFQSTWISGRQIRLNRVHNLILSLLSVS
jgi:hypothetical protein